MQRLPPLNALRVFEAAARHLSFTRAADELAVTQAAVSHQIKALEQHLEIKLFLRQKRGLALTDQGRVYFPEVQRALDLLRDATARVTRDSDANRLTLSTIPSFAARWLVPRLGTFISEFPEVDLRLATTQELTDFIRDSVDVAIRYGRGDYPGLHVTLLMTEEVYPVCSPALRERIALNEPQDIRNHTLLHDHDEDEWARWLEVAGVQGVDLQAGHWYKDSSLLLQAATAGQGIALARDVLAAEDLASGRLVRLFNQSMPSDFAYYFVCPLESADKPKIAAFRDWMQREIAASADTGPRG